MNRLAKYLITIFLFMFSISSVYAAMSDFWTIQSSPGGTEVWRINSSGNMISGTANDLTCNGNLTANYFVIRNTVSLRGAVTLSTTSINGGLTVSGTSSFGDLANFTATTSTMTDATITTIYSDSVDGYDLSSQFLLIGVDTTTIAGDVTTVTDDLDTLESGAVYSTGTTMSGDLDMGNNKVTSIASASINGGLTVSGTSSFGDNVGVVGDITSTGTITNTGDIYIYGNGDVYLTDSGSNLDVGGWIEARGEIHAEAGIYLTGSDGDLHAADDVIVGDDLEVSGLATIGETLNVEGNITSPTGTAYVNTISTYSGLNLLLDGQLRVVNGITIPPDTFIYLDNTTAKTLGWNSADSYFSFNDDLNVEGNITSEGATLTSNSNPQLILSGTGGTLVTEGAITCDPSSEEIRTLMSGTSYYFVISTWTQTY